MTSNLHQVKKTVQVKLCETRRRENQNIARFAKAALHKLPGKLGLNVSFVCPVCHVLSCLSCLSKNMTYFKITKKYNLSPMTV